MVQEGTRGPSEQYAGQLASTTHVAWAAHQGTPSRSEQRPVTKRVETCREAMGRSHDGMRLRNWRMTWTHEEAEKSVSGGLLYRYKR
jgi:hypothetical protein